MLPCPEEGVVIGSCDIETPSLTDSYIYVACYHNFGDGRLYTFVNEDYYSEYYEELVSKCQGTVKPLSDFKKFIETNPTLVGHNFQYFDKFMINDYLKTNVQWNNIRDTLVISRLTNNTQKGFSHSLDAWGTRLGYPKLNFKRFEEFSVDMCVYCEVDTLLSTKVYQHLYPKVAKQGLEKAFRIESEFASNIRDQKAYGFKFDVEFATGVKAEMDMFLDDLQEEIRRDYPPKPKLVNKKSIKLHYNKTGEKSVRNLKKFMTDTGTHLDSIEGDFSFIEWEPFNLASPPQVVERLNEAGWRPVEFNKPTPPMISKGLKLGTPKVSETNLMTLPDDAPESAKKLALWRKVFVRRNMVEQWLDFGTETGRIHGDVNPIGSWSQRCSHSKPNTANPAKASYGKDGEPLVGLDGYWGWDSRRMWTVSTTAPNPTDKSMAYHGSFSSEEETKKFLDTYSKYGRVLIGCDAEGIQLRALAHYMGDVDYINAVADGDKSNKTDVHNVNLRLSKGILKTRDDAKTFIYAFLLGGGLYKLGVIAGAPVGKEKQVGNRLKKTFLQELPALAALKGQGDNFVRQGWFRGIDGRRVPVPSNHLFLTALLQSFEAIVMKEFYNKACAYIRHHKLDAHIVAFVHDEIQVDCSVEDAPRLTKVLPKILTKVGESLGSQIRLDGNAQVGLSWADSH